MGEQGNRERQWLRLHAITAPIGVAAMTALLTWLGQAAGETGENQPATVRFLNSAASKAYLATVTYALLAAIVEGVVRMVFWALSEHKKAVQRYKDAGRAEGRAEGQARAQARGRARGRREGRAETAKEYEVKLVAAKAETAKEYEAKLAAAKERAKAEGIDLDKFLNQ